MANFLCWAAEPAHDERKLIGLKDRFLGVHRGSQAFQNNQKGELLYKKTKIYTRKGEKNVTQLLYNDDISQETIIKVIL